MSHSLSLQARLEIGEILAASDQSLGPPGSFIPAFYANHYTGYIQVRMDLNRMASVCCQLYIIFQLPECADAATPGTLVLLYHIGTSDSFFQ